MTRVIATTVNNIKTFHITSESATPSYYGNRANRRIGTHSALKNKIELIAEFEFSGSSRNIDVTSDGLTLAVSGEYPPQIKIFDLVDLSQTTVFSLKGMPLHFKFLSDDWSKLLSLRADRKLDFYNKGGDLFTVPLPMRCRHFSYSYPTANLLLASENQKILRLNLEMGQFLEPIETTAKVANQVIIAEEYQIICAAFETGEIEFYDPRDASRSAVATLQQPEEVTQIAFDDTGLKLAVGLSDGTVPLYDIRRSTPLFKYSHRNQQPINSLHFHNTGKLISSDRRGCRIYNVDDGEFFTSFETKAALNSITPYQNSGLLFGAVEAEKIQVMLIPELGPAPRWASFLDNVITDFEEEKEEGNEMFKDMKFITREEIEKFDMHHLIKTSVLKPYMHGFFIPRELYRFITDKSGTQGGDYSKFIKDIREVRQEQIEQQRITRERKEKKRSAGDLEVTENDSRRKAKKKIALQKDPYYQP